MPSGQLVRSMANLHQTGHPNRLPSLFVDYGLQVDCEVSDVDIGLAQLHPTLGVSEYIQALSRAGQLQVLMQGQTLESYQSFWHKYQRIRPEHPCFKKNMCLSRCVPCFLHADEGTSIKKRGVLVLSLQSALGAGSRRSADVNFSGDTFLTRILFSVMMTKTYARNKAPLYALLSHFADSCTNAFENGIEVVINDQRTNLHLCILGLKGDWPALTKCGRLNRHHLRDAPGSNNPAGICHLCLAGQTGYAWHEWDDSAAWLDTMDTAPLPWTTPSPLMKIPHDETDSADFFKIDLFHTMHKGVLADLAASTIATCVYIASIGAGCFVFTGSNFGHHCPGPGDFDRRAADLR